jgi:hypothetical protein
MTNDLFMECRISSSETWLNSDTVSLSLVEGRFHRVRGCFQDAGDLSPSRGARLKNGKTGLQDGKIGIKELDVKYCKDAGDENVI